MPLRRALLAVALPCLTAVLGLLSGCAWALWPGVVGGIVFCLLFLVAAGIWFFVVELSDLRRTAYLSAATMTIAYLACAGGSTSWLPAARGVETTCSVTSETARGSDLVIYETHLTCADDTRHTYTSHTSHDTGDHLSLVYDPDDFIAPTLTTEISAGPVYAWTAIPALTTTILLRLAEAAWGCHGPLGKRRHQREP